MPELSERKNVGCSNAAQKLSSGDTMLKISKLKTLINAYGNFHSAKSTLAKKLR